MPRTLVIVLRWDHDEDRRIRSETDHFIDFMDGYPNCDVQILHIDTYGTDDHARSSQVAASFKGLVEARAIGTEDTVVVYYNRHAGRRGASPGKKMLRDKIMKGIDLWHNPSSSGVYWDPIADEISTHCSNWLVLADCCYAERTMDGWKFGLGKPLQRGNNVAVLAASRHDQLTSSSEDWTNRLTDAIESGIDDNGSVSAQEIHDRIVSAWEDEHVKPQFATFGTSNDVFIAL